MTGFKNELIDNILPYWINNMVDNTNGGFYGCIDGDNHLHPESNKGVVLNTRILWTFSTAYRITHNKQYLDIANRAFEYIKTFFLDNEHGGVYWELDSKGNPVNTKKQTYAQGFALYGFSEYYRATNDEEALELSKDFFFLLEKCYDQNTGGYFEAYTKTWESIEDMRLSDKDENEKKTMNTHLHVLEPYTNLCRIWKDERLLASQKRLISLFTNKILDKKNYHLNLFFDENWLVKSNAVSYGHDIEASWLLYEAAEVLGDKDILKDIIELSIKIADVAQEGIQVDGSLIYEKKGSHIDTERHWWVQAEGIVGFMYAFKNTKDEKYKKIAEKLWQYIQTNIVDKERGEWFWSRLSDGTINTKDDKAGFWKCPYHNSRMCMEMIEHFNLC